MGVNPSLWYMPWQTNSLRARPAAAGLQQAGAKYRPITSWQTGAYSVRWFCYGRGRRAAAQTKQNHYFVDPPQVDKGHLGKLAAQPADYFFWRSPTQQNKNFVAFAARLCYTIIGVSRKLIINNALFLKRLSLVSQDVRIQSISMHECFNYCQWTHMYRFRI